MDYQPVFNTLFPSGSTGKLVLQQCQACGHTNYPQRELCGACLADQLTWQAQIETGTVLSHTTLHYSLEPLFSKQLPRRIASIQLQCGVIVFAHLAGEFEIGDAIKVIIVEDAAGNQVLMGYVGVLDDIDLLRQQAGLIEEDV